MSNDVRYLLYSHVDDYEMPYLKGIYDSKYNVVNEMNNLRMINIDYCGFKYYSLWENKFYSVIAQRVGTDPDEFEKEVKDIVFADNHKTPPEFMFNIKGEDGNE